MGRSRATAIDGEMPGIAPPRIPTHIPMKMKISDWKLAIVPKPSARFLKISDIFGLLI